MLILQQITSRVDATASAVLFVVFLRVPRWPVGAGGTCGVGLMMLSLHAQGCVWHWFNKGHRYRHSLHRFHAPTLRDDGLREVPPFFRVQFGSDRHIEGELEAVGGLMANPLVRGVRHPLLWVATHLG